jgi:hypothetical protein
MSSAATVPAKDAATSTRKLGISWTLLCLALAIHVTDEALSGFLSVYNPTVVALRAKLGFWPMPTFEFRDWLTGVVLAVIILLALSPVVFGGSRRIRPFFYFFAILMILNGLGHTAGTIFGRTVSSIHFPRPMPGFYSSPFLIAAATYALAQLRKTKQAGA